MAWSEDDFEAERSAVLKSLAEKVDRDSQFTPEEATLLREVLSVYIGIRAWGIIARFIVIALAAVGAAVTAYDYLVERFFG